MISHLPVSAYPVEAAAQVMCAVWLSVSLCALDSRPLAAVQSAAAVSATRVLLGADDGELMVLSACCDARKVAMSHVRSIPLLPMPARWSIQMQA